MQAVKHILRKASQSMSTITTSSSSSSSFAIIDVFLQYFLNINFTSSQIAIIQFLIYSENQLL